MKEYIYFTKQERQQFYLLCTVMTILIILYAYPYPKTSDKTAQFTLVEAIKSTELEHKKLTAKQPSLSLRPFDPNKVTASQLEEMGLPLQGIKSLLKYRKLGGTIRDLRHFKKMYGFEHLNDDVLAKNLIFKTKQKPQTTYFPSVANDTFQSNTELRIDPVAQFDKVKPVATSKKSYISINETDTIELKTLYGIGSFRAKRIINFRNALGGFHDLNQLYDTHNVPDSIITKHIGKMMIDSLSIHKLNMNEASKEDLARHPYISWQAAKVICNFRKEHGPYNTPSELYNLHGLDSSTVRKIIPYLSTNR